MYDPRKSSTNELLNAVWFYDNGSSPIGGLPIEYYLKELYFRGPETQLYHSNLTVSERLAIEKNKNRRFA